MLARVKWRGDRYRMRSGAQGIAEWEYGTLLAFHGTEPYCMIAWDGADQNSRGRLIKKAYETVIVTTWFKYHGEQDG